MKFIKEYLSIDETISYLKDNGVFQADIGFLQDLERERKLTPLVYLKANFLTDEKFFCFDYELVTAYFEPVNFILLDHFEYDEAFCTNFIFLNWGSDFSFKIEKIVLSNSKENLTGQKGEIASPIFKSETNSEYFERIKKLDLQCIRFRKSDLDNLFSNQPKQDLFKEAFGFSLVKNDNSLLEQKISDLQNLLEHAENNIFVMQADTDILIEENKQLKAQLEQQATQPSDTATDEKNPLKDIRTQNNLIRLLLAVNEMAKDKKGQSLDYSKDYNKENLQAINKKLDLLDYTNIGEAAFTTLATLIREKQGKGL